MIPHLLYPHLQKFLSMFCWSKSHFYRISNCMFPRNLELLLHVRLPMSLIGICFEDWDHPPLKIGIIIRQFVCTPNFTISSCPTSAGSSHLFTACYPHVGRLSAHKSQFLIAFHHHLLILKSKSSKSTFFCWFSLLFLASLAMFIHFPCRIPKFARELPVFDRRPRPRP